MKIQLITNNNKNGKVSYIKITIAKNIEVLCIKLVYIIAVKLQIYVCI
jgi:hypothetical protein